MFSFLLFSSTYALVSLVCALPLVPRDVWAPKITSPVATTVWFAGSTHTITWDVSSKPSQVTNPVGMVFLRINDATQSAPLAQGFPLAAGQVNVTVPANTLPSDQYHVVLIGDSGNWSPSFTIASRMHVP